MKKVTLSIVLLLLAISFACVEEKECCVFPPVDDNSLTNQSWLLFEMGYSPGAGYYTKEIPPTPAQVMTFHTDGKLLTTIENLKTFKFYRILNDPNDPDQKILALFKTAPPDDVQDTSALEHSYSIRFSEGDLFLHFRYCIEGCHLGFRRIAEED